MNLALKLTENMTTSPFLPVSALEKYLVNPNIGAWERETISTPHLDNIISYLIAFMFKQCGVETRRYVASYPGSSPAEGEPGYKLEVRTSVLHVSPWTKQYGEACTYSDVRIVVYQSSPQMKKACSFFMTIEVYPVKNTCPSLPAYLTVFYNMTTTFGPQSTRPA